jgi:hypothetical protein
MQRLILPMIALAATLHAQPQSSTLPVETKVWVATKLYSGIQMYFAHAEGAPEFDLDRDFQQHLKAAFAAPDRRTFDLASMAFMGKLRNGHSFLLRRVAVQELRAESRLHVASHD